MKTCSNCRGDGCYSDVDGNDILCPDCRGLGKVDDVTRYCAVCGEREGSLYAKHCCTDDNMIEG